MPDQKRGKVIARALALLLLKVVLLWVGLAVMMFAAIGHVDTHIQRDPIGYAIFFMMAALAIGAVLTLVLTILSWRTLNRPRSDIYCWHCGYDLRGNPTCMTCPECGQETAGR